ncbi:sulfurtransferase TusA family protein [Enteractinococcus coprophilus]|uniref:5-methyltetrahydropteroyltriglutamate--homocysteine methyltransferase n=1 Tax=Enteractinococcus coprophilus TaxID=1027633 RepID=A0A543A075_9MICC|nr:sulfurtransferase TusA family protein [Enteractinococcus coprophilus]TQL65998.1 5-methyltetrahydropteroyltriglutamate--homocysteine methyltransferase [Enteractinococcus coprophilus]
MSMPTVHPYPPKTSFNGGDLDCGNGLLLLIRKHIDPLEPGELLEIVSHDSTVEVDLPSWCRLTKNELLNMHTEPGVWRFLVSKGPFTPPADAALPTVTARPAAHPETPLAPLKLKKKRKKPQMAITQEVVTPHIPDSLPEPADAPNIEPLSVLSLGSWPRPRWMLESLHQHLEGRLDDDAFQADADDAVQLAIAAQERAGIDVVTDGEQRRDNYSSFVGGILQNCQLIPVTDLLPYVDDPDQFNKELQALDVPAGEVRHPAVFGPLGRNDPLTVHEVQYAQSIATKPVKVSLPGPYLLTRTMWMECVSDRAYDNREQLAVDIVRILREEIAYLLAEGTILVQLDEPVLTEVLYGEQGQGGRTFMCGALGERGAQDEELAFAHQLLEQVTEGFPTDRLALHVCRGNWTTDETSALTGGYEPLVPLFRSVNVGTLILELCTPRAGELEALAGIRDDQRIGVGVINQKDSANDTVDDVAARAERAIRLFGYERVLLNTDCGFATFADNPIQSARAAERDLRLIAQARDQLRTKYQHGA